METETGKLISYVIPVFNEEKNIPVLYKNLKNVLMALPYGQEIIFINDGSCDGTMSELKKISALDGNVRIIDFSRNFGKEEAVTAGLNHCRGDACLMLDADLQHPIEIIPKFIERWEKGAEVIIGVREKNKGEGMVKKVGSYFFYKIINTISDLEIVTRSTDFRLIDRLVIDEFNKLKEKNRMTRALIDWLGFRREYIKFRANERLHGKPTYNYWKLVRLAFNSMVSLSLFPLKLAGYLGIFIILTSGMMGVFVFVTKYIIHNLEYTGPAILAIIILFLIGIVLICLGFIALYIANIHTEVSNRPLYIIRKNKDGRQ